MVKKNRHKFCFICNEGKDMMRRNSTWRIKAIVTSNVSSRNFDSSAYMESFISGKGHEMSSITMWIDSLRKEGVVLKTTGWMSGLCPLALGHTVLSTHTCDNPPTHNQCTLVHTSCPYKAGEKTGRNPTITRLSLKPRIKCMREELLSNPFRDWRRRKAIVKVYVLERGVRQEGWLPHSSGTCQARVLSSVDSGDSHVTSWVSCLVPCHGEDYSDHCLQLHGKPPRTQVSQHTHTHLHTPFSVTGHKRNDTSLPNVQMSHCISKSNEVNSQNSSRGVS